MSPHVTGDDSRRGPDGPRNPPMSPEAARVEGAIDQAIARGDFDDLPGAGKPLRLPSTHDPNWWIKQRLNEGDVDRDALLPPVVLLRREHDRRDETLAELRDEQSARDYAHDYTERVLADRSANPMARMLAPELDPEVAASRWHELRASQAPADGRAAAGPSASAAADRRPRPRWWPFGRRR